MVSDTGMKPTIYIYIVSNYGVSSSHGSQLKTLWLVGSFNLFTGYHETSLKIPVDDDYILFDAPVWY